MMENQHMPGNMAALVQAKRPGTGSVLGNGGGQCSDS